jgi:predicted secreted protein
MNLYQLTDQYKNALAVLTDSELPPEVVADTLEGLEGELKVKAVNVAAFFQNLEVDVEAMKAAEQRIANRRKSIENRVNQLKEYLHQNMLKAGITEIKCPEFEIKLAKNPASVEVYDILMLDEKFIVKKVTESPDKKAIKKAIDEGAEVEGARLITDKTRLVIK